MGLFDSLFGKPKETVLDGLFRQLLANTHYGSENPFIQKVINEFNFGEGLAYIASRSPVRPNIDHATLGPDDVFPANSFQLNRDDKMFYCVYTDIESLKKDAQTEYYWALPSRVVARIAGLSSLKRIFLNPGSKNQIWLGYDKPIAQLSDLVESEADRVRVALTGDAASQLRLARMYQSGIFGAGKINEVVRFLKLSGEQGNGEAMHALATIYRQREIVVADNPAEAFKWYLRAANSGWANSQGSVGVCYANGEGVAVNLIESFRWTKKAAENGNTVAQGNLSIYLEKGIGCKENKAESLAWLEKSAEGGYGQSQRNFAIHLLQSGPKDALNPRAERFLNESARHGDAVAMFVLFRMYYEGEGATKNLDSAVEWLFSASELGLAQAQFARGHFHLAGQIGKVDPRLAKVWLLKALSGGVQNAIAYIAVASALGDGNSTTDDDVIEAMAWYSLTPSKEVSAAAPLSGLASEYPQLVSAAKARALANAKLLKSA